MEAPTLISLSNAAFDIATILSICFNSALSNFMKIISSSNLSFPNQLYHNSDNCSMIYRLRGMIYGFAV